MNQEKERKQIVCVKWPVRWPGIVAMVVLVVVLAAFIVFRGGASKTREVEVTVVSTLPLPLYTMESLRCPMKRIQTR